MGIREETVKKKMALAGWGTSKELLAALNRKKLEVPTMQELYMWRRRGVIRFRSKRFPPKGTGAPRAMYPIPEIVSQVKRLRKLQGRALPLIQISEQVHQEYVERALRFIEGPHTAHFTEEGSLVLPEGPGEQLVKFTAKTRRMLARAMVHMVKDNKESAMSAMQGVFEELDFVRPLAWILKNSEIRIDPQLQEAVAKWTEEQLQDDKRMVAEIIAEFRPGRVAATKA